MTAEALTPGLRRRLAQVETRYEELGLAMSDPKTTSDPNRIREVGQELSSLTSVVDTVRALRAAETRVNEAQELIESDDGELRDLALEDLAAASIEVDALTTKLRSLLVPRDPLDEKNVIVEIRGGEGGEEAALFAADLYRMYTRYAERSGLQVEIVSASQAELGGYKEVIARVAGQGAYSKLKFESGGHRVQRVPATETQGRIHTSACTVAVMPEADEVEDVNINPADLRIDTYRASGAGGQHINKTDSAVRITHLPTGIVVECQDDRSQHKNKASALKVLAARIKDVQLREQQSKEAATRKSLIGSGDRSERIRTYNFPQGRMTDHRINLTLYKLDFIMDGDLTELTNALAAEHQAELLAALGD